MRAAPTSRVPYGDLPHHAEWGLACTPDGSHEGEWYFVMLAQFSPSYPGHGDHLLNAQAHQL
jgi:hypothetical protein